MTLILNNDEIASMTSMDSVLAGLEEAYSELAAGRGVTRRRSDTLVPAPQQGSLYSLKSMDGIAPHLGVGAVRINSDILTWPRITGQRRRVKVPMAPGKRYTGLILLFSTTTGEPLAIIPDGIVQRLRVGATNGLGVKYLAREDAETVGLIGSGFQAETQLEAAAAVRKIGRVKLFSPNQDRRERFARTVGARLALDIEAVETPHAAVTDADIVLCATSSTQAVYRAEWLAPGVHVSAIKRTEIESAALERTDVVVIHSRDPGPLATVSDGVDLAEVGEREIREFGGVSVDALPLLPELVAGRHPGRVNATQTTAFINNLGFGYQFAVVGAAVLAAARKSGIGRELPTDWFTETEHP